MAKVVVLLIHCLEMGGKASLVRIGIGCQCQCQHPCNINEHDAHIYGPLL